METEMEKEEEMQCAKSYCRPKVIGTVQTQHLWEANKVNVSSFLWNSAEEKIIKKINKNWIWLLSPNYVCLHSHTRDFNLCCDMLYVHIIQNLEALENSTGMRNATRGVEKKRKQWEKEWDGETIIMSERAGRAHRRRLSLLYSEMESNLATTLWCASVNISSAVKNGQTARKGSLRKFSLVESGLSISISRIL